MIYLSMSHVDTTRTLSYKESVQWCLCFRLEHVEKGELQGQQKKCASWLLLTPVSRYWTHAPSEDPEALMNPYGEDGDNYEMNWLINKYLQVAFLIVDEMHIAC